MRQDHDPSFGSTDDATDYDRKGLPGGKSGAAKSKLGLGVAAVFLAAFLAWLYLTPVDSDTRSDGSPPAGATTQTRP
jgi:hypothetical protein